MVQLWRRSLQDAQSQFPFKVAAGVVLPDHVHLIIALPREDADLSKRIGIAKAAFTRRIKAPISNTNASRRKHRETDVWQRRFYERMMGDEDEYNAFFDYLRYNPVKHGYVKCPDDWPHSSFRYWAD